MNMRKITLYLIAFTAFCACQHDIVRNTDFTVTLDSSNTYVAGDPVRFNIEGEVDNIVFYSGETGLQYETEGSKPVVIKNMQNYLPVYEYVWETPGTYDVTFVGTNENYLQSTRQMHQMCVIIIENL